MQSAIVIKRLYSATAENDGRRVLVDRLWPRGRKRDDPGIDEWYQAASPSGKLRQRWHSGEISYEIFAGAYRQELESTSDCLVPLLRYARAGNLTLLTASRHPEQSHLPLLRQCLLDALAAEDRACQSGPSSPTCYLPECPLFRR